MASYSLSFSTALELVDGGWTIEYVLVVADIIDIAAVAIGVSLVIEEIPSEGYL
jgi:hypothetical protein